MLALFSKRQKKGAEPETPNDDAEALSADVAVEQSAPKLDEETIRKNIAEKLRNYRPVEREANFSGPKFYKS